MTDSAYRIYPAWKEVLVYEETKDHELRLNCDCVEPYMVSVPSSDLWAAKMPAWAQERREIILERLRKANCIIREEGIFLTSIGSPDGTFHVEVESQPDDRGCPMQWIRVVANVNSEVLLDIGGASLAGLVEFSRPGVLTLPFRINDTKLQLGINVPARLFWFHPMEELPLEQFAAALAAKLPPPAPAPNFEASLPSPLSALTSLVICLLFVACGIWQVIDGIRPRDHWIGGLCILFFGACAAVPISDLRRYSRRKKRPRQDSPDHH